MKVVPLYCPNCGAPVGKGANFCSHCGSPIVIDDEVKRSEHTYRQIDEARIREADVHERIELNKMEMKHQQKKEEFRNQVVTFLLVVGFFLFMLFVVIPNMF